MTDQSVTLMLVVVVIVVIFLIFDFWSNSPINIQCCGNIYYILSHVQKLTFAVVNFSVMFTNFGLIHLVILIRSIE